MLVVYAQIAGFTPQAALATADVLDDPPPFVLQTALNDFYVAYELNAYTLLVVFNGPSGDVVSDGVA